MVVAGKWRGCCRTDEPCRVAGGAVRSRSSGFWRFASQACGRTMRNKYFFKSADPTISCAGARKWGEKWICDNSFCSNEHSFGDLFSSVQFICSVRSFVQLFILSLFIHSFSSMWWFFLGFHSIIRSVIHSFIRSFVHSCIHSLVWDDSSVVHNIVLLPPLSIQRMTKRTRNPNRLNWMPVVRSISCSAMQSPRWPVLWKEIIKVEIFDMYNFTRVYVTNGEEDEDQMIRGEKKKKKYSKRVA